ncbi:MULTISPECIES: hypothetical protein [Thauera]|uniref:Uncharacterized protein n=1 Tax=Thauera chlorobenzoica TaxID=96773 RepID=A0A1H5UXT1_9RHOO|nr:MULTISPECIES: hypothetical protein [Thauera]APR05351.1 hypothetical protein Tchl_2525 [Thauera chlorobenzoica]MCK2097477.1 hypothetical protein [Thauera aromatica]SEF79228.1 hypothetical protein SAMN05216242_10628 [Thauera chlorobenzoica]
MQSTPRSGPKVDTTALFERFPHLAPRISAMWGTRDGRKYLSSLIMDTRDGQRQGFPPEHAKTIVRLLLEHDIAYPEFEPVDDRVWNER